MIVRSDESVDRIDPPTWGPDAAASPEDYRAWLALQPPAIEAAERAEDPDRRAARAPLLSIVVPLERPVLGFLEECLASVVGQSDERWELLLSAGQSEAERTALRLVRELDAGEPRIRVVTPRSVEGHGAIVNDAVARATGDYVLVLRPHDTLDGDALARWADAMRGTGTGPPGLLYADEDHLDGEGRRERPDFKPDWDPDLLLSLPYLGFAVLIRRTVFLSVGGLRPHFGRGQHYDLQLRASEQSERIVHVPTVLYHRRDGGSTGEARDESLDLGQEGGNRAALEAALDRRDIQGTLEPGPLPGSFHVRRRPAHSSSVSVIVPFRDKAALTAGCLASIARAPGHELTEIVLIDNGSSEPETAVLRRDLERRHDVRVLDYPGAFNWAAINNLAAATCRTDLLLFLNNDIEATSEGWLGSLVEHGQRPEVGAVGARLVYPDKSVQHAGVVLGMQAVAAHIFNGLPPGRDGYSCWDKLVRGYSALTAACMLVRREVFEELEGFDDRFGVAFNDIDFCLRVADAGYRLLYTPHAELTHFESVSRGLSGYSADIGKFLTRWWDRLMQDDPAYNRNLGRFAPWCPLRSPGEDERWLAAMTGLRPAESGA